MDPDGIAAELWQPARQCPAAQGRERRGAGLAGPGTGLGRGATVACSAELGRDSAARRGTSAHLGDAKYPGRSARAAGPRTRRAGRPRKARLAQWLRRGENGGRVVPQGHPSPRPMGLGRATGP